MTELKMPRGRFITAKEIQQEYGFSRGAAEAIMRALPKTKIGRRVFVPRADVERYVDEHTVPADGIRRSA